MIGFGEIAKTLMKVYPKRTVLGMSLFIGQAFLYNAITFGYATILIDFFDVPSGHTGYYYAVIAVGNFIGPLLLGPLFDTVGRRPMIAGTYIASGVLLLGTAFLFQQGTLNATTTTLCWTVVLFFASTGASSAYLTVSEVFPMETRAMAIAFFYAIGTAIGGITGPQLFSRLIETGNTDNVALAFAIGAVLMILAGVVAVFSALDAERQSLEDIAKPLTAPLILGRRGRRSGLRACRSPRAGYVGRMIGALILGLVAGFIGRALVPNDIFSGMSGPSSWLASIVLGLVGALVGYFVFTRGLGIGDDDAFDLGGILSAIIGVVMMSCWWPASSRGARGRAVRPARMEQGEWTPGRWPGVACRAPAA